jgi:hypothetical protein
MPDFDIPESEISSLSDTQEIVISVLSLISGTLSIMGSCTIVYLVATDTHKTPYKRIMLGLSSCDIVASATYASQPFWLPADTSQRVWASGSDASCSVLGFLTQFSFSAMWYNGMLSAYFLLTVRLGVRTSKFATSYEPILHAVSLGFNLCTASIGLIFGFYSENELGPGCWIAEFPKGCEVNGGCMGNWIGWIFGGLPILFIFLVNIFCNGVIYRYVRATITRTSRASMHGSSHQQRRINAVATQSFLYVVTFFSAYSWAFIVKVAESLGVQAAHEASLFPLLVLQATFLPLQGFSNLCVYTRPNYLRVREEHPGETIMWSIQQAWFKNRESRRMNYVDPSASKNLYSSEPSAHSSSNIEEARTKDSQSFSHSFTKDLRVQQDTKMRVSFGIHSGALLDWYSEDEDKDLHFDDEDNNMDQVQDAEAATTANKKVDEKVLEESREPSAPQPSHDPFDEKEGSEEMVVFGESDENEDPFEATDEGEENE